MEKNKPVIISSVVDEASTLQKKILIENFGFKETSEIMFENPVYEYKGIKLFTLNESSIYTDKLRNLDATLIIFASKHSSKAGMKALLTHTPGIWTDDVSYGGEAFRIGLAPAKELRYSFDLLNKHANNNKRVNEYQVGIEVTHHGPFIPNVPSVFVEQGGTKEEWEDINAAEVVASTIFELAIDHLNSKIPEKKAIVGFGGNHYCARFLKILKNEDLSFGHIIPKHALEETTPEMIRLAWERTIAKEKIAIIDKKGTKSAHRQMIKQALEGITEPISK